MRAALPADAAQHLTACGFAGETGPVQLLSADHAVLGLGAPGATAGPYQYGALATALPPGTAWRFADGTPDLDDAVLGFCLGAYRAGLLKTSPPAARAQLVPPAGCEAILARAQTVWLVRDLINLPANLLGPAELAAIAMRITGDLGMTSSLVTGTDLQAGYPTIAFTGAGSVRPPCVMIGQWRGSGAHESSPLISLCGKGVVFDTGGYDLKPPAAMLRMKKDMAGAAISLGLACLVMQADLPVRLELRLGCVENAISGCAMRPSDVVHTRAGISVEIGNTDAEGRLVLCDLLHDAAASGPNLLLDFATLTGAARVALGPDIAALFTNNEAIAERFAAASRHTGDTCWRLPLHAGYKA